MDLSQREMLPLMVKNIYKTKTVLIGDKFMMQRITDPKLISQLNSLPSDSDSPNIQNSSAEQNSPSLTPTGMQQITDPKLIAQLNSTPSDSEKFNYITGEQRTPIDTARDLLYGGLTGLGKGGQAIASTLTGGYAPTVDFDKMFSGIASPKKSISQNLVQGAASYAPYAIAGGTSVPGLISSGMAHGYATSDPNTPLSDKLLNSLQEGSIGALSGGIGEGASLMPIYNSAKSYISNLLAKEPTPPPALDYSKPLGSFGNINSEFTNNQFTTPSSLQPLEKDNSTENIRNALVESIQDGRSLQDSAKNLAKDISTTYTTNKDNLSNGYKTLFAQPTDRPKMINMPGVGTVATSEKTNLGDSTIRNSQYKRLYGDADIKDQNIDNLHDEYVNNPTIENGHNLQREFGYEVGDLLSKQKNGLLDSDGKARLRSYITMRNLIKNDINTEIGSINKNYSDGYTQLSKDWEGKIIPFHSDSDLRDIANGTVTNPAKEQVKGIFKSPEPAIDNVTNMLNPDSKSYITHLSVGRNLKKLDSDKLLAVKNNLENSGTENYLSPDQNNMFKQLDLSTANDQAIDNENARRQSIVKLLQKAHTSSQNKQMKLSSNTQQGLQQASNEQNNYLNKVNALKEELIKSQSKRQLDRSKIMKKIIGAGIGGVTAHFLPGVPTDLIGAYIGNKMVE